MPDYPGAVPRTFDGLAGIKYKLGEVPSLLDWNGACGKGVSDDTSVINQAIAQAPRGGMVHVPKGVYAHTGDLILPSKPITLFGDGYAHPLNWYQRVISPVLPNADNIKNLGSAIWNTDSGQHFKPGTPASAAFIGDGSTRSWQLDNRANYITDGDVNGVIVTFGLSGETGKDFYLGPDRQTITQDAGGATLTGSQTLTVNYGAAFVDMQLTLQNMVFYGGSGVIKIPNMNTSLNFNVESVISMFCTGAAFELGEDDVTGNAYMSRFSKSYFYNNDIGILNHFACDVNVDDCFFQDHTSRALEVRAANTRITKNTFISGNTGTEDILLVPTGFLTSNALYNLRISHNKFGNENSVSGEARVKIRVGSAAIKASDPDFYVANLDVHDNTFVGTFPLAGLPTACISLHSPMQNSRIHHNDFITATYAVDDSDATQSSVGGNNQYEDNQHSFGTQPFRSGGASFNEISGLDFGLKAVAQPSAVDHQLIENVIALSEAFNIWGLFALTVTTSQTDPFNGTGACRLNKTGVGGSVGLGSTTSTAGAQIFSVWLKQGSTSTAVIEIQDHLGAVLARQILGLDAQWRRYTLRVVNISASAVIVPFIFPDLPANSSAETIYAFGAQINAGDEAGGYVRTDSVAISRTHGFRTPTDFNVGRDALIDRNLAVSGDSVVDGDDSCTIQTCTQALQVVFTFGSVSLLESAIGFGVRMTLNNDGTMRIQRSADGFATLIDTPFRFNASGEIEIQVPLKLAAVTISQPLKVNASGVVVSSPIDLAGNGVDVAGITGIVNGGTGGNTAATARTGLDVYSKSEVNTLLSGKATAGASTSSNGTPAHTHTQN